MKESRKQFIKEAHSAACEGWKRKIEQEFPKLFESEFKEGDWVIGFFNDSKEYTEEPWRIGGFTGTGTKYAIPEKTQATIPVQHV